jgi:hypothetical protein
MPISNVMLSHFFQPASMTDPTSSRPLDADARRLALEAMATLAHIKKIAADQLLRPAGVPEDLILTFVKGRDAATGEALTKRQSGAKILEKLGRDGRDGDVVRKLVDLAANWNSFHLADDEYDARAVVQKARDIVGVLAAADEKERAEHERAMRERVEDQRKDKARTLRQQSALLLEQFDEASREDVDPQHRGYLLQDLLNRLFDLHGIAIIKAFVRNGGAEQIDAAFEFEGWHYLVECRWRAKLANIRELDGLSGQIGRSGKQTMGLFLSINGWSDNVVPAMKQNQDKSIILMEGYDLRAVLSQPLDLRLLLKAKLSALNLQSEPYFSVTQLLR